MTDTDWTPDTEAAVLKLLRLARAARAYAAHNAPSSGSEQDQMLAKMRDAPPAVLAHALALTIADVNARLVALSLFPDDAVLAAFRTHVAEAGPREATRS